METIGVKLLISLLLGAAIGLERQSVRISDSEEAADSGIRTFSLVGLLGCLAAIFYVNDLPLVFILLTAGFVILVCSHYFLSASKSNDFGLTTEISFILTFLIGICAGTNVLPLELIVAIAVVVIVILAVKSRSENILSRVSRSEIESFISFAILGLVILPFLNDTTYTLADVPLVRSILEGMNLDVARFDSLELLNPRKLWFIVVLITGIDVLGYILSRFVGKKRGFTFTSFVGGFVSSTLTTQSLAQKSKGTPNSNYLVGAAILANQASFFQIFLLVGPFNSSWLVAILPTLIIMIVSSGIISLYFLRQKGDLKDSEQENEETDQSDKKIFSIIPALQFALLISVVKILTSLCLILFGKTGFVISSIIASFAGLDAILISLAGMAGDSITFGFALFTFILVNATNLLAKTFYCYLQGSREFTVKFLISVVIIILLSFFGFLFV